MERKRASKWYRWLWWSPLLTILSFIFLSVAFYFTQNWEESIILLAASLGSSLWHLILLIPARDKKSQFVRWHSRQALFLAGIYSVIPLIFILAYGIDILYYLEDVLYFVPALLIFWFFGNRWGQKQAERGVCSLARWFGRADELPGPALHVETLVEPIRDDAWLEREKANKWYRFLWLSPLLPIIIHMYDPGWKWVYNEFCRPYYSGCTNWRLSESITALVAVSGFALWHLILLFPALNKKSAFVRWHARQALVLAGIKTIVYLAYSLSIGGFWIFLLVVLWFFSNQRGQKQAKSGDCTLMRWFGRAEALPGPALDVAGLVDIIRFSHDPQERNQALVQLHHFGMVESIDGSHVEIPVYSSPAVTESSSPKMKKRGVVIISFVGLFLFFLFAMNLLNTIESKQGAIARYRIQQITQGKELTPLELLKHGLYLAKIGDIEGALELFAYLQSNYPRMEIHEFDWYVLCRYGNLWGNAADVVDACEKMVELAPNFGLLREGRGINRAILGDHEGAIEDFNYLIKWANGNYEREESIYLREAWIAELEAGRNPFDEETLEELRNEYRN